jgi:hypothetical protein
MKIDAQHAAIACQRPLQSCNSPNERGLARPIVSDYQEGLSPPELERDVGGYGPASIAYRHTLHRNEGQRSRHH